MSQTRVHCHRPYAQLDRTSPTLDPRPASSLIPATWWRPREDLPICVHRRQILLNIGATACLRASPGYYVDTASATGQTPCPPGQYSSNEGSVSCSSTSPGNTPRSMHQRIRDLRTGFLPARLGRHKLHSFSCRILRLISGIYVLPTLLVREVPTLEGSTGCEMTQPGYYTSGAGSVDAIACEPGTYQPNSGADMCLAIPGTYVSNEAAIEYATCTTGTFQPNAGSSECLVVDAGHYATGEGAQNQIPCPVTTYQPLTGQTSCNDVEAGHYTSSTGSSNQAPCEPGTYQPMAKSTSCRDSPAGHFVPDSASTAFVACPVGTYQPISASSSCLQADEGHFVDSSSQLSQTACQKGTYQPNLGSSECLLADPGHFVDTTAATEQTVCPAGTYQSREGQSSCTFTSTDFFSSEPGSWTRPHVLQANINH